MSDNVEPNTVNHYFWWPEGLERDAAGLTAQEREAQPYPYNCFVPALWPGPGAPPTFPPTNGDQVFKTDEPSASGEPVA